MRLSKRFLDFLDNLIDLKDLGLDVKVVRESLNPLALLSFEGVKSFPLLLELREFVQQLETCCVLGRAQTLRLDLISGTKL